MARKKRRGKNLLSFTFNSPSEGAFPLKLFLLKYVVNLIEHVEFNQKFLELVLALMDFKSKKEFFLFFIDRIDKKVMFDNEEDKDIRKWTQREFSKIGRNDYDDVFANHILMYASDESYGIKKHEIMKYLKDLLQNFYEHELDHFTQKFPSKVEELGNIFGLDDDDKELFCFLYCMYGINSRKFDVLADEFAFDDFIRFASIATGIPVSRVRIKIGKKGAMYKSGFFQSIDVKRNDFYCFEDAILEYISGMGKQTLIERYIKRDSKKPIDLTNFTIPQKDCEIVKSLLSSSAPCNILFYGEAGTGKTEFARSIVRDAGFEPKFVSFGNEQENYFENLDIVKSRMIALRVGVNTIDPHKHVLIVDEADFILNSRYMFFRVKDTIDKGWLNDFLDTSKVKTIWIANETGYIEESTQRRFHYSLYFPNFSCVEREKIFNTLLQKHPLKKIIGKDLITHLSEEYHVNAAGIASALESLRMVVPEKDQIPKEVERILRRLLARHEELTHGIGQGGRKLARIVEQYDPAILHTDTDMDMFESSLRLFNQRLQESDGDDKMSVNILFYGIPGTGKTEYVKYLAKLLKRRLLVKRYSDLESKYVGETEKNIAKAFREAERADAILFIDEADSLFTARESAQYSWEVSRTNEFLSQLENFRGIFVACTNLLLNLDKAAMRRFAWKIEFKPLRRSDRYHIFEKYFAFPGREIPLSVRRKVEAVDDLVAGDVKALWNRYRYFKPEEINYEGIAIELKKEVQLRDEKKLIVGF